MRLRRPLGSAFFAHSACLLLFTATPAAAQYTDPPSTAPNFWLSAGLGGGSAGQSSGLIAADASAWISKGVIVGGVRKAVVTAYEYGDDSSDLAVLVGLRTPPSFAALIGTVGYSSALTKCSRATCPAGYSSSASGAMAYSFQGRVNLSVFGLGFEIFGAQGKGVNRFSAAVLMLQIGSFEH
jgi:hypothetical protein